MARIATDPNYYIPATFPRATSGTDLFLKEDVQALAAAVSTHDHSTGKGLPLAAGSIPNGTITSAMIADGTIVAGDIADGAITSAKILDGTIATADLADASVTNAKLASDTARANLLTNGGFEIWQRGNGPFTANGAYCADRWLLALAGTDTLSVDRNAPSADSAFGSRTCAGCVFTIGSGAGASGLRQDLPGADGQQLRGRTVTFSMRVLATAANAVRIGLFSDGAGGANTFSSYHPGGSVYATLSVTATFPLDATAFYMLVRFAASCTAYLDNAMLVVGSVPADYAPLHPADDLARCLRYYQPLRAAAQFTAPTASVQQMSTPLPVRATMAITPTVTVTTTVTNTANVTVPPTAAMSSPEGGYFQVANVAIGNAYDIGRLIVLEGNP